MNVSVRAFMLLLRNYLSVDATVHSQEHETLKRECVWVPPARFSTEAQAYCPSSLDGAYLVLQDPVSKEWLRVVAEPISEAWAKAEMRRREE